jgi:hypothetical protein
MLSNPCDACHTSLVDKGQLQGWFPDPFELHEVRYFSAGHPTRLVRDGSAESYDEPPSEQPRQVAAPMGAPGTGSALIGPDPPIERDIPRSGTRLYLRDIEAGLPGSLIPRERHRWAILGLVTLVIGVAALLIAIGR